MSTDNAETRFLLQSNNRCELPAFNVFAYYTAS